MQTVADNDTSFTDFHSNFKKSKLSLWEKLGAEVAKVGMYRGSCLESTLLKNPKITLKVVSQRTTQRGSTTRRCGIAAC